MLGTILASAIAYKIGKNSGRNESVRESNFDYQEELENMRRHSLLREEKTNEMYNAQLKCIAQCKALELASKSGASVEDIIEIQKKYLNN